MALAICDGIHSGGRTKELDETSFVGMGFTPSGAQRYTNTAVEMFCPGS